MVILASTEKVDFSLIIITFMYLIKFVFLILKFFEYTCQILRFESLAILSNLKLDVFSKQHEVDVNCGLRVYLNIMQTLPFCKRD